MRNLILAVMLILSSNVFAQDKVSLSIHQDIRLGISGDNRGNPPGTINVLARFKMQGNQQKYGYMVVFPEYEYAQLNGLDYKRYSVNAGYTFNKLVLKNFEASTSLGFGWIDRTVTMFSFSGAGELAYKINNIKVSVIVQLTERKDLLVLYNTNVVRFSGFLGIEVNLN